MMMTMMTMMMMRKDEDISDELRMGVVVARKSVRVCHGRWLSQPLISGDRDDHLENSGRCDMYEPGDSRLFE